MLAEILFLRRKDKKHQKKKLNCEFIRINTSKCYDENYEIGRIQSFISELKDRQLKKLEKESNKKIKEIEDEIKELKLLSQITQQNQSVLNVLSKKYYLPYKNG